MWLLVSKTHTDTPKQVIAKTLTKEYTASLVYNRLNLLEQELRLTLFALSSPHPLLTAYINVMPPSTSFGLGLRASSRQHKSSLDASIPKGSIVALVTPFKPTGEIDYDKYRSLLEWHIKEGTDGLCALGTTSEAAVMSSSERVEMLKITQEVAKGRIPYMVGTGTINPLTCIENAKQALEYGADASLVVTPYYVKPTQKGLIQHYQSIAEAVPDLPIIMYNVPGRTGCDMSPETTAEAIKACKGVVVGFKDATGDTSRVAKLRELCGPSFLLFSGDDETSAEFTLKGGDGCISVTANVAPSQVASVMAAALMKDEAKVKELNGPLEGLNTKLFCQPNPIPTKYVLGKMGMMEKVLRAPLHELDVEFEGVVDLAMKEAGLS
jgi:4-hydroxy-tetrahydrodipicolinate synthase